MKLDTLTEQKIDPVTYRQVLSHYPTGVTVVTALDADDRPLGMVIGSFSSVSLDPPLVGFLPDKASKTWQKMAPIGRFCINVLGSHQQTISKQISGKAADKFLGIGYQLNANKLPIIDDALIAIECSTYNICDAGDHWFVMGGVLSLNVIRDGDPMLFHRGRYGGFTEIG